MQPIMSLMLQHAIVRSGSYFLSNSHTHTSDSFNCDHKINDYICKSL